MRRIGLLLAAYLAIASLAHAQVGRRVPLLAGTPEDRAFTEIINAPDTAKKLELLEKFLADFGQREDMALMAHETFVSLYAAEKNYAKAFEHGDKVLAMAPDQFETAAQLVRIAQEMGDVEKAFAYGDKAGAILARFQAAPPPEGTSAEDWELRKKTALANAGSEIQFLQYALFNTANQTRDPLRKAALLERFLKAFPEGPYAQTAQSLTAAAYQQAQNYPKMLEFAQGVLAKDPANLGMLILLADYLSERGEQLDKAEEHANKAMEVLAAAQKPEQLTEEQWAQQKSLQQGLTLSALGQIHIQKNRLPQAEDAFRKARPLLKPDAVTYGRNLYRLGFTLARAKKTAEARTVLQEAVAMKGPYSPLAQDTLDKLGAAPPKKRR
jgi:tetratricopeptide (TPR) repeat protein